jgi:hypothetical protein
LTSLKQAQQVKSAVEGADVAVRGDDDRAPPGDRKRSDDEALGAGVKRFADYRKLLDEDAPD